MGIVKWCAWEVAPKTPYYKSTSECSCIFHPNWQDFYGLLVFGKILNVLSFYIMLLCKVADGPMLNN